MKPPRYWHRKTGVFTVDEETFRFVAWGHSELDDDDAARQAEERLRRAEKRFRDIHSAQWQYGYDQLPIREVLVEEIDAFGTPAGFITRSRYGALVLNTDQVLFADIDAPAPGCLAFWKRKPSEDDQVAGIKARLAADPATARLGYRLYKTPAGFRVAFTERAPDMRGREAKAILEACAADKLYVKLCERQQGSRARLTAKPWRCKVPRPPVAFPYSPEEWEAYRAWCREYDDAARGFAACRFLVQSGPEARGAVADVIRRHDELSGALSTRPLA
jgi:hypothetical protein